MKTLLNKEQQILVIQLLDASWDKSYHAKRYCDAEKNDIGGSAQYSLKQFGKADKEVERLQGLLGLK